MFDLSLFNGNFSGALMQKQAVNEILKQNELTQRFGLYLTPKQATELVATRNTALKANGRIEFGGGMIDKMIDAFCNSPYISMHNYVQTLHELIEIFYYYKNETMDFLSDDELIAYMEKSYDGICQGSLELLSGTVLDKMSRNVRSGRAVDDEVEDDDNEDDESYNEK